MTENFIFGISLTASFLAGVLALFAPCCITFLFPSYLGTIFKEQKKVMFYTIIFAFGLGSILIPIALGFRFFMYFFDSFHKEIYYLGSIILILMGLMTIKPLFSIPMFFRFKPEINKKLNIGSVYGLGFMSGLTSSCYAPVLFAAVTLTSLSPSLIQAILVSFAYVLGIVFPLFLLSLAYQKSTKLITGELRKKINKIFTWLGAIIFIVSGVLIAVFNYLGKIEMKQMDGYSKDLRLLIFQISKYFQNPVFDLVIFITIIYIFYKLLIKKNK